MDAVLNWLWQGSVVAIASCAMLVALRHAHANVRYTVCWAALLLILALPALPAIPASSPEVDAFLSTDTDPIVSLPDVWWTSTAAMLVAWMIWGSVQLARFVSAIVAIRRARARSRAFPAHLEASLPTWRRLRFEGRRATLRLSNAVTSAAVLGWGEPIIAIAPSLIRTLDPEDLDRVLIHEWAHVQRRDDVVNVLQIAIRGAAGWHPAVWWLDRRLHVEREIACDETTIARTGSPKSYARCLMKLATVREATRAMRTAPAMSSASGLHTRVLKIVSARGSIAPLWSRTIATAILVTLSLTSVTVAGLTLVEAASLVQPLVSARALSTTPHQVAPITLPVRAEGTRAPSPRRAADRPPSAQHPTSEQLPAPSPSGIELPVSNIPQVPSPAASTRAGSVDAEPAPPAIPELSIVPLTPQPQPNASTDPPRTPWGVAAAGGTALGRKSKDAGVATAGAFTRLARRVAGAF